jgi:hypothetical protein
MARRARTFRGWLAGFFCGYSATVKPFARCCGAAGPAHYVGASIVLEKNPVSFTFVATMLLIAGVSLGVVLMAIMVVGSEADKAIR